MSDAMTERRKGRETWGSLRKLPSKRWQARYPGEDGKTYTARTEDDRPLTFLTKTDAREWLNQTHVKIAKGEWLTPAEAARRRRVEEASAALRDVTFREYAERWLERIEREPCKKTGRPRRPATVMSYRGRVHNHLMGILGDVRVRDIDDDRFRAVVAELVAIPSALRPNAKNNGVAGHVIKTLKTILREALREGILAVVPDIVTPREKSVRHDDEHTPEDDVASPAQVDALYEAMPQPWRIAVLFAAWCQLRRGEALGLQRRDIVWNADRTAATLYVRRQKNGTTGELSDPKSDKSERSMSVPPVMIDRLRAHLDSRVANGAAAPVVPSDSDPLLHVNTQRWHTIWAQARSKVSGLPDGYRFHDLRHTGLTRFAQEGATLAELMRRGGHADVNVVLRYQKATMARDVELAARMSATVASELEAAA